MAGRSSSTPASPRMNKHAVMLAHPCSFVLFDLGGVLVRLGGMAKVQQLAGFESEEELWHRWLASPWIRRFEQGKCEPLEFANGMVRSWGLPVSAEEFLDVFKAVPVGLFPGARELVALTRDHLPVGCLSNSNVLHWELMGKHWGLAGLFDRAFLSYELGMVKPDHEIFEHVVHSLGAPPERVVLLDDNQLNVQGARAVGLTAVQVRGPAQAKSALVDLGVLSGGG
ncbi:MAG: HAD family hydrolase [Acidimicrobiales bacterium]